MKTKITLLLLISVSLVLMAGSGPPRQFTLEWSHSPTPAEELTGYVLYSGSQSNNLAVFMALPYTNQVYLANFPNGIYYFGLTARSTNGLESDFSNIIKVTIPHHPFNLKIQ